MIPHKCRSLIVHIHGCFQLFQPGPLLFHEVKALQQLQSADHDLFCE